MNDRILQAYQVMATIVGINLILVMLGLLKYPPFEIPWFYQNAHIFLFIDQLHGVLFMVLIVLIAKLGLREKWSWGFIVSIVLFACIPLVSFWSERRTTHRVHAATAPTP
ncbi:MAG: DUF3817 domain-containing protein [Actinomycetales bacterium]|nr:DUF3817 domain-containing protein [Actinomycetales bacterium]